MRLLVAVLHREDLLDDVLSALVELEEPDAVVVESRSGLELLERDLPVVEGLRSKERRSNTKNGPSRETARHPDFDNNQLLLPPNTTALLPPNRSNGG